jgi:hypothetical protein
VDDVDGVTSEWVLAIMWSSIDELLAPDFFWNLHTTGGLEVDAKKNGSVHGHNAGGIARG